MARKKQRNKKKQKPKTAKKHKNTNTKTTPQKTTAKKQQNVAATNFPMADEELTTVDDLTDFQLDDLMEKHPLFGTLADVVRFTEEAWEDPALG